MLQSFSKGQFSPQLFFPIGNWNKTNVYEIITQYKSYQQCRTVLNSVNSVNSFNSYSAVLPPSPMVFFNWQNMSWSQPELLYGYPLSVRRTETLFLLLTSPHIILSLATRWLIIILDTSNYDQKISAACTFPPNIYFCCLQDSYVGVWKLPEGTRTHTLTGHNGGVTGISLQGSLAATSSYDSMVRTMVQWF